ncbi:MAG: hypothetical protein BGO26_20435 [Actinobacteria bacterium 69-20]|jgi:hypothetical protein|nr:addiction module protein [Actinomycetota bacterium]OJV24862.1 MAG: hypothetical protein BGO26_20435 [Actinobacteria bacterium 69-20]
MVNPALLSQAKGLDVADRWQLAAELWASVEAEDFPVAPEIRALLEERRAEAVSDPLVGRTWAEIKADWHDARR